MQTLRKKTSPCKYKNEPSRYLGEGACFRAKLIGVLEVSEARGDRMCQDALADLKMAIRAAGEHKQRITVHVAIDGLRLRDDKTGDSLYHHPVHKISFIAQDMTDSRAFGYVFGSPDTGHRFFGIKTDKAASQVVIAMRDLFQVVFELKKKEIELAKQHISEQKSRYGSSNLFSDSSTLPSVKSSAESSTKTSAASVTSEPNKSGAIADLVDLELELSSIQQGIHQMERITPSTDPFGDSFTSFPKPILPPPPRSGRVLSPPRRRQQQQPNTTTPSTSSAREVSLFDSPTSDAGMQEDDWFSPPITKSTSPLPIAEAEEIKLSSESDKVSLSYKSTEEIQKSILDQFDVFTDLDPLGTGRSKPYVDKKLFFHELKNPPKKVLKDLVTGTSTTSLPQQSEPPLFKANFKQSSSLDPFADEDPFEKSDPFGSNIGDLKPLDPFNTDFVIDFKMYEQTSQSKSAESETTAQFKFPPVETILSGEPESLDSSSLFDSARSFDVQFASLKLSPKRSVSPRQDSAQARIGSTSLDLSSGSDGAPEPPPRPPVGAPALIKPPPLPPKKQVSDSVIARPPPRPPHYDYLEGTDSPPLPMPTRKLKPHSVEIARQQSEDDYLMPVRGESPLTTGLLLPPPRRKKPEDNARLNEITKNLTEDADFGKFDDFDKVAEKSTVEVSSQLPKVSEVTEHNDQKPDEESTLDSITLTDLTMGKFEDLAKKLNVPESKLRDMTLSQLTNLLRRVKQTTPTQSKSVTELKSEFSTNFTDVAKSESSFDKYAVFRELLETEIKKEPPKVENDPFEDEIPVKDTTPVDSKIDRYAALRDILSEDLKKDEEVISEMKNEIIEEVENDTEVKTIEEPEEIKQHVEEKPEKIEISIPIKESIIEKPKEEKIADVITPENKMAPIATSGSEGGVSISSPEEIKPPGEDGGGWAIFEGGEANSPWSSDSKEFVTASPMDRKPRRDQGNEEWWPDSYDDDEGWDYRLDAHGATSGRRGPVRYRECRHSSSSRDASPWEDEPRDLWSRRPPPPRRPYCRSRDSWDEEEEDYVYEHRRHPGSRERRREESWSVEGTRRHGPPRRRHRSDMDHHCCGEWEHERDTVRRQTRYSERDRYAVPRSIDNEEYNCPVDSQHVSRQRGYKQRPASASEADRRCGVSTGPRRARSRGEPPHPMVPSSSSASQPPVHRHRQIKQARANPPPRPTFEDDFSEQSPLDTPSPKNKFEFLPEEIPKETRTLGRKRPERCRPEKEFATMSRQRNVFKYDFSEEFKPKVEPPVQQMVAEKEYASTPVRQESQFEDDFSPPPQSKASTTQTSTIVAAENEDAVIQNAVTVRNNNIGRQNNHKAMKRLSACGRIDLNIKKSESINIFARESDPFEDDDFFTKDGDSDIGTPGTKNGENGVKGREGWTEDFGCFDTVEEEK